MRDTQRKKVYTWENHTLCIYDYPTIEMRSVKTLVKKISKRYGIITPDVGHGQGARRAFYDHSHKVVFPRWARSVPVVCHEMAHAIVNGVYFKGSAGHGREFVRVYIDLLHWAKVAEDAALVRTARDYGLDFCAPGNVTPRALKKR